MSHGARCSIRTALCHAAGSRSRTHSPTASPTVSEAARRVGAFISNSRQTTACCPLGQSADTGIGHAFVTRMSGWLIGHTSVRHGCVRKRTGASGLRLLTAARRTSAEAFRAPSDSHAATPDDAHRAVSQSKSKRADPRACSLVESHLCVSRLLDERLEVCILGKSGELDIVLNKFFHT